MKIIIIGKIGERYSELNLIEQFDDVKVERIDLDEDGNEIITYTLPDGTIPDDIDNWQQREDPVVRDGWVVMKSERPDGNYIANENGEWVIDVNAYVERNTETQNNLIKEANTVISILQDAIDLDMQEDGDEDKLKAWKKYRVLLSRMDLTAEDMEIPVKP